MVTFNKFIEMFRNLKSDAVPQPPRPSKETGKKTKAREEENNENLDSSNEPEENIFVESDDEIQSEKKPKFTFMKPNRKYKKTKKSGKHSSSTVNTQATGNVINVVNSKGVHLGNKYFTGPTYMAQQPQYMWNEGYDSEPDKEIKKCNDIKLLLEAKIKPEHDYIDYISKNLGKEWQRFFIKLGYSKNRIETMVIDTEKYGVSEARYKLLLDWINNEDDPSLGRLATLLWQDGERTLVKHLALMYKQYKK